MFNSKLFLIFAATKNRSARISVNAMTVQYKFPDGQITRLGEMTHDTAMPQIGHTVTLFGSECPVVSINWNCDTAEVTVTLGLPIVAPLPMDAPLNSPLP